MASNETDKATDETAANPQQAQADVRAAQQQALARRLDRIQNKVLVLSGKGGVGKSSVAGNLAISLSQAGKQVGLLDIDIHGPSIPKLLGIETRPARSHEDSIVPPTLGENLKVMSIGFLLQDRDDAVIWRGPLKMNVIRQFLADVEWGDLDFLIVDSPPGTGDEPLSICQLLGHAEGAVVVTTPQELALADVRKCINFCHKLDIPVLGVVENMSGFACPKCGEVTDVFGSGGGESMAGDMAVPFLGRIPIDPNIVTACDQGEPYVQRYADSPAADSFGRIADRVLELQKAKTPDAAPSAHAPAEGTAPKRIALPLAAGRVSQHFGHVESFALVDVDPETRAILTQKQAEAPMHAPGVLPKWLQEQKVDVVLASGMGSRAQDLLAQAGIEVVTGAPSDDPETVVRAYLDGKLETRENICDH